MYEVFEVLRKHRLRLNALKCAFGIGSGKFLSYMITHWGIEVILDQFMVIQCLQPSRNPKEVQRLMGMVAALNRFISRSTKHYKPFFQLLKKWRDYIWTPKCERKSKDWKNTWQRPQYSHDLRVGKTCTCIYQY